MTDLFVTHVDIFGPQLRIHGLLNKAQMGVIQNNIDSAIRRMDNKRNVISLQIGIVCFAWRKGKFSRVKVTSIPSPQDATVYFLDYGEEVTLPVGKLSLIRQPKMLEDFPYQVSSYILCGVVNDWNMKQIEEIKQDLCDKTVRIQPQLIIGDYKIVRVFSNNQDYSEYLIHVKKCGVPLSLDDLQENFSQFIGKIKVNHHSNNTISTTSVPKRSMPDNVYQPPARRHAQNVMNSMINATAIPTQNTIFFSPHSMVHQNTMLSDRGRITQTVQGLPNISYAKMPQLSSPHLTPIVYSPQQQQRRELQQEISPPTTKRPIATFKSNTLMVGRKYEVYCCYVENGPCLFSVHLNAMENNLNNMMSELESSSLQNLSERPSVGMACVARFSEDSQLYRAVIMSIKPTACQVVYVDYGNTEIVPFPDLYDIPPNLLDQKIFAIRFALSGYKDLEPIDDNIKDTFKEMVLHQTLTLKVMPLEGPPLVQYCELYNGNVNILEELKTLKNRKLTYCEAPVLHSDEEVVIRYVESPKKFFVQKVNSIKLFDEMMDELYLYCSKAKDCGLDSFENGTACAVKFDNAWYRAEIIGQYGNRVCIRHIDFGNERKVDPTHLCSLTDSLAKFPPQAIQCCLKGFENTETLSDSATVQLEMLAESDDDNRRHFKCQVFKIERNGSMLVNLIDDKMHPELNLMKKLYKLSMPFNKYIGLEKEGFENADPSVENKFEEYNNKKYFDSKRTADPKQTIEAAPISAEWETGSSGSADNRRSGSRENRMRKPNRYRDAGNNGGGGGDADYSPRPFRENNRREREPPIYRGKNLPPRLQKKQADNRRFKENKFQSSYERQRNFNSESPTKTNYISPENSMVEYESHSYPLDSGVAMSSEIPEEYLPSNFTYNVEELNLPSREEALICWWISPHQFYTHLKSKTDTFKSVMREIQVFYKGKTPTTEPLTVGSNVVAKYRVDNILYRAKIIACNQSLKKYKVTFVDFGNQSTVGENDVYLVEKRFGTHPIMAHFCSFDSVVSNFDHRYITTQVEKYLQPGTVVICDYLKKNNDVYFVELEINGKSLKESLISEGTLSALDTGMKLELLRNQRIKAKIVAVKDLLNFQIEIEGCDVKLMCCYNDIKFVKSNQQLSMEFKNEYEGKMCIVHVMDVTEEKILMLQPHIPLFNNEIPNGIYNYPIIFQTFNITVAYIEKTNKLFVHPVAIEDTLSTILDDMFNYYESNGEQLKDTRKGAICAANSSDGNWYRARIERTPQSTNDENSVEVYYFDYGNFEILTKDKLKRLETHFYEFCSALAVSCYLPLKSITTDDDESVINEMQCLTNNYVLTLQILEQYKSCWIVDISSDGYSLLNVLEEKKLIQSRDIEYIKNIIDQNNIPEQEEENKSNENLKNIENANEDATINQEIIVESIQYQNMTAAYLSHCDNPGRFYLHLEEDYNELKKLQDNIQIVAGSLPPLMSIVTGAPCIALYSVDDIWYRAKVIDNEIMAVQFIDYGNTDVVTDSSYIKEMNEAFQEIKPFAIPCALPIAPKGTVDWTDEANNIFNESYDKSLLFNYVIKNDRKNYINMIIDGINVAEKLVTDGFAKHLEIVPSGKTCYISHINSISDFYIQMENDANALELIDGHLAGYEEFPVLEKCEEGLICAALFPDDDSWYRAKILHEAEGGTEVLFIDYGNTALSPELREISKDIANLPVLSKKCTLWCPSNILAWSDAAETKFNELSATGQTEFKVELVEPGEHAVVNLFYDEKNVVDDLEPLCEKKILTDVDFDQSTISSETTGPEASLRNAVVSHIDSPMNFFIQFATDTEILQNVTDTLNGDIELEKISSPTMNSLCAAVFPEDEILYRAKILSPDEMENDAFKVIFIDFGNTSVSKDIRTLPEELSKVDSLAKRCSLEATTDCDFTSTEAVNIFISLLDSFDNESIQIEIVDHMKDPWVVRMFCKNTNINKKFEKLLQENKQVGNTSEEHDTSITNPEEKDNVENVENLENVANVENLENEKNVENIENLENVENVENLEDIEDIENVEKVENTKDIENIENVEKVENTEDIEKVKKEEPLSKESLDALITHVNSSEMFYVQIKTDAANVRSITEILSNADSFEQMQNIEEGMLCAALSPEDGAYYRAKILKGNDTHSWETFLIDFGATVESTDCRVLPEDLKTIEPLAKKCSINLNSDTDVVAINENFTKYVEKHFGETFQMNIVNETEDNLNVELSMKGINLLSELIKFNSEENDIKSSEQQKVFIVHINSPGDFYIQLAENVNILEKISESLGNADDLEKIISSPEKDEILAAIFPDDGAFYRAKIIKEPNATNEEENTHNESENSDTQKSEYEVIFIDFGNTATTVNLCKLPDELKEYEPLAKHCTLNVEDDDSNIDLNSELVKECFNSAIDAHINETFHIEVTEKSPDIWKVKLFFKGTDIIEELKKALKESEETDSKLSEIWDSPKKVLPKDSNDDNTEEININIDSSNSVADLPEETHNDTISSNENNESNKSYSTSTEDTNSNEKLMSASEVKLAKKFWTECVNSDELLPTLNDKLTERATSELNIGGHLKISTEQLTKKSLKSSSTYAMAATKKDSVNLSKSLDQLEPKKN